MTGRPRGTSPGRAEDELRTAGYEPLEPYPGTVLSPWRVTCTECEVERTITLNYVRRGRRCSHRDPERTKVPVEAAEEELRAAGYRPLEPYPGNVGIGWLAMCLTCGNPRRPSIGKIRQGRRCAHHNIYD